MTFCPSLPGTAPVCLCGWVYLLIILTLQSIPVWTSNYTVNKCIEALKCTCDANILYVSMLFVTMCIDNEWLVGASDGPAPWLLDGVGTITKSAYEGGKWNLERLSDLLQSTQTGSPEWETRLVRTTEDLCTMGKLVIASPSVCIYSATAECHVFHK